MAIDALRRLISFIVLCLAQALVFNHIHLLGHATILLYVYFVVMFPRNYHRWASLLWSFALGLSVDLFTNTPGLAAASLTLTGFLQPFLLELFIPREAPENMKSSVSTLGFSKFFTLAAFLVFIHCLVFFTLESFTLFNWLHWSLSIAGSIVLTLVLLMVAVSFFTPAPSKEQVDAITFSADFKQSIKESWGVFDIVGTLVVIGLCACFYAYFW